MLELELVKIILLEKGVENIIGREKPPEKSNIDIREESGGERSNKSLGTLDF